MDLLVEAVRNLEMRYLNLKTTLAALSVGAVLAFSGAASAATLTGALCGNKWIGLSQNGTELSALMCQNGNTTGGKNSPIGQLGWTDLAELNGSGTSGILTVDGSTKTWSLSSTSGYEMIGISVKQGNGFAFFKLDLDDALTGMFGTGNNAPNGSVFSHYNAWGMGSSSTVPLPAAAWMLIAGLGGLAALKRRKRT
ncbi:MAG: VPLPA-CTERM sorting domain-containing protein [Tateyamaria sp.]|uniref:VPLPA-CTERM sorting domain-containing protein n=1 Tax=Tateyamaria sp. TaxID=1929288 RepID=UPI00326FD310